MKLQPTNQSMPNNSRTNFCGGKPEDFVRLTGKAMQAARDAINTRGMRIGELDLFSLSAGEMRGSFGEILAFPSEFAEFIGNPQLLQLKYSTLKGPKTLKEGVSAVFSGTPLQQVQQSVELFKSWFVGMIESKEIRIPETSISDYVTAISPVSKVVK